MDIKNAIGVALIPALALTACSTAQPTRAATVSEDAGSGSINSATPSDSASSPATSRSSAPSSGSTQTRTQTGTGISAGPSRCAAAVLRASQGRAEGSAGHFHVALLLTNRGGAPCLLDGYPGVSFTAGTDAHQVGAPAQRDRRYRAAPVTLAPGASAHATVTVANYGVYDPSQCRPVASTGYRVYPPGFTRSLLIAAPGTVCSRPGVQDFEVTVVRRGTSPD